MSRKKYDGDDLYQIDQSVRSFCDAHPDELDDNEHDELQAMLEERARAISDILGVTVHSVCEDDDD